ncbi:phage tail protein [Methylobacterium aquaticum]|uniref:phage tail protein n=1 Tax=Methylobacterium aquaticum TaxID=270351 RepID=UPI003D169B4C
MAAIACTLRDKTGTLTASGTSAYTLALAQTITDYSRHFEVAFFVGSQNTGPSTLSINGLAPKRLLRRHNRELGPGDLTPFVLYRALYIGGIDAYIITSPEIAAPGTIRMQAGQDPDPGWLPCDGRQVSRSDYRALLDAIGYTFGAGDGSTTFNVPDMRGRAPFGTDGGTNRLTGAGGLGGNLGNAGGAETVTLTTAQMPSHSHNGTAQAGGGTAGGTTGPAGDHDHGGQVGAAGAHGHGVTIDQGGSHGHNGTAGQAGGEPRAFSFTTANANIAAAGASFPFVADISVDGTFPNSRTTSPQAGHTHPVSIPQSGDHTHTGSVTNAGDHQHGIPGVGTHTHSLPAAAAHTHPLTINNTGDGQAHANVPPGLVVQFVIKT